MSKILLTGGAGYIGSHTCVELLELGYEVVIYDNFSNSNFEAIKRVENITRKTIKFIEGDIRDELKLMNSLEGYDAVMHFAGLKAIGESITTPLEYYDNNVQGTLCLLRAMKKLNIKKLVFSSSAAVYGNPQTCPIDESFPVGETTNPYGTSKYMIERILEDLYTSDCSFKIAILRYFNPIGAHESGLIGEDPNGVPNNLMPYISQVAVKKLEFLNIFGSDYETKDGTGVRDYVHVVDLANAHVKAVEYLENQASVSSVLKVNIGTGSGYSVLDIVKAFEKASGQKIPYRIVNRRAGDVASCYSNPQKAKDILGWEAKFSLDDMCKSSWNWQKKNPNGYEKT